MQIRYTFVLSFLNTLGSIIFPTGNAWVPSDESPPCFTNASNLLSEKSVY